MEESKETQVTIVEFKRPISILVGKCLVERGFVLATTSGYEVSQPFKDNSLGILLPEKEGVPIKFMWFWTLYAPKRIHMANIYFGLDNTDQNNWKVTVYGKYFLEYVGSLMKEIGAELGIQHIFVELKKEELEYESTHVYFPDFL